MCQLRPMSGRLRLVVDRLGLMGFRSRTMRVRPRLVTDQLKLGRRASGSMRSGLR